jgi:hypothetical protein
MMSDLDESSPPDTSCGFSLSTPARVGCSGRDDPLVAPWLSGCIIGQTFEDPVPLDPERVQQRCTAVLRQEPPIG